MAQGYGLGAAGLAGFGQSQRREATQMMGEYAKQDQARKLQGEAMERQKKQQNAQLTASAGAAIGASFGPWGALAGGIIGGIAGESF